MSCMQWDGEGYIRSMEWFGTNPDPDSPECDRTRIRLLAGSGVTDAWGSWEMELSSVLCEPLGPVLAISFVATPAVLEPMIITTWSAFPTDGYGVLRATSWDCNGRPRRDTPFDYHATIAYGS